MFLGRCLSQEPENNVGAMKFGSEREFKTAVTELKWLRKDKGALTENDFAVVSQKYNFPADFLKVGLDDLSQPNDYLTSKSRWYPIIYSWVKQEKQYSLNLFKLQFDYIQSKYLATVFLGAIGYLLLFISLFTQDLLPVPLTWSISIALTLTITVAGILFNKKRRRDGYSATLQEMGFQRIIDSNNDFITQNYKSVMYVGHIILIKMMASPLLITIPQGVKEVEEEKKPTKLGRLLGKVHLRSKEIKKEKVRIPEFYVENVDMEYERRIKELSGS